MATQYLHVTRCQRRAGRHRRSATDSPVLFPSRSYHEDRLISWAHLMIKVKAVQLFWMRVIVLRLWALGRGSCGERPNKVNRKSFSTVSTELLLFRLYVNGNWHYNGWYEESDTAPHTSHCVLHRLAETSLASASFTKRTCATFHQKMTEGASYLLSTEQKGP